MHPGAAGHGQLKIGNFHRQKNRRLYTYLLTPEGVAAKVVVKVRFLKWKISEYDRLREEIQSLAAEASRVDPADTTRQIR